MMEGWKTDKLGCLCTMYQPQTIATNQLNEHGRYLVYGANGIIGRYDKYNHEKSQLLMTCRGNTCGEITVTKPFSWINGNAMVICPCDNKINIKYLEYYLKHINLEHIITGGAQPQITRTALRLLKISYPESPYEQTAIAAILSKVDETIASVQAGISAAERLKKSLMQNLLTGRMKPDGTLRTEEEFYLDEKFGRVPLGWKVQKVKDFGEVITGKTPPTEKPDVFSDKEHGFMFVTPGDVDTAKYIEQTERYVSEKGIKFSYTLPQNAVCEICIGSTIGKIGITTKECCTNQQITSVIVNDDNDAEFFYYAMSTRKDHFKSVAGINATPQINKSEYSKYKILCPKTKAEQIEIAQKLSAIDTEINKKQNKITVLERLKKSLMQNLLTGKIRVKQLKY
jgi:type I restriction enzyme S subunit